MPEKSVLFSSLNVSVSLVMAGLFAMASTYIATVLKNINLKFDNHKENLIAEQKARESAVIEIKKDLGEAFNRIRDLENVQNVLKTEHDMYCKTIHKGSK